MSWSIQSIFNKICLTIYKASQSVNIGPSVYFEKLGKKKVNKEKEIEKHRKLPHGSHLEYGGHLQNV